MAVLIGALTRTMAVLGSVPGPAAIVTARVPLSFRDDRQMSLGASVPRTAGVTVTLDQVKT
jgi:hypothetical protein